MIERAEIFLKDYLKLLTLLDYLISKGFVKLDLSKEIKLLESFLKEFKWVDEVR